MVKDRGSGHSRTWWILSVVEVYDLVCNVLCLLAWVVHTRWQYGSNTGGFVNTAPPPDAKVASNRCRQVDWGWVGLCQHYGSRVLTRHAREASVLQLVQGLRFPCVAIVETTKRVIGDSSTA